MFQKVHLIFLFFVSLLLIQFSSLHDHQTGLISSSHLQIKTGGNGFEEQEDSGCCSSSSSRLRSRILRCLRCSCLGSSDSHDFEEQDEESSRGLEGSIGEVTEDPQGPPAPQVPPISQGPLTPQEAPGVRREETDEERASKCRRLESQISKLETVYTRLGCTGGPEDIPACKHIWDRIQQLRRRLKRKYGVIESTKL
ncbi:hypothetical protein HWI79_2493 [Cryptosporidium felis]|nr:hypothetical protein HWI79_2493 [Cryptosporidium felis]